MKHTKTHIVLFRYFLSFWFMCWIGFLGYGQGLEGEIDSLRKAYPKQTGTDKIITLYDLSYAISSESVEEAIRYDSIALREAYNIQDSAWISAILIDLSYLHKNDFNYQTSYQILRRAEKIAIASGNDLQLTECYTALGNYFFDMNVYDSALFYHHEALKFKEKGGNKISIARTFNNIGLIYYKIDDIENALKYYSEALELKLEVGDTSTTFNNYYNIGLIYNSSDNYEKAKYNFLKAAQVAKKYNPSKLSYAYSGLGQVYVKENDERAAKKYLKLSLEYNEKINDRNLKSSNYYYLAKLANKNNQFSDALNSIEKSQTIAVELADKQRIRNNYKLYAEIFESQNIYDSAYYYQKKYSIIEDSIFNERLAKNLASVQLNQQKEETEKVIAEKDEDISQKTKLSRLLATVLVLSVMLIVIVTRNYIQTNRINTKLKESNEEIEKQKEKVENRNAQLAEAQKTIKSQNNRLRNINSELENAVQLRTKELENSNIKLEKAVKDLDDFIYKTSHDLRGPIATMQGVIQIGLMESKDPSLSAYFEQLQSISDVANTKLHKLIEVHDMYLKQPVLENVNIHELVKQATEKAGATNDNGKIDLIHEVKTQNGWISDREFFTMIVKNMIANAFHFSSKNKPFVKVKVCDQKPYLKIIFEDNGFGIQESEKEKVFDIFFKGAPSRLGTGLEIYAAKIAVEKLKGQIKLVKPRDNTIYEVLLPTLKVTG